jgi:hypothetical protein
VAKVTAVLIIKRCRTVLTQRCARSPSNEVANTCQQPPVRRVTVSIRPFFAGPPGGTGRVCAPTARRVGSVRSSWVVLPVCPCERACGSGGPRWPLGDASGDAAPDVSGCLPMFRAVAPVGCYASSGCPWMPADVRGCPPAHWGSSPPARTWFPKVRRLNEVWDALLDT